MPTFGFSAFLKLLSLNPRPQRREVRVRLSPTEGGYDFHRSLRLKAFRLMVRGEDLAGLIEDAAGLGNPAEARSVAAGLRRLDEWRTANSGEVTDLPSSLYVSPSGSFRVSFVPDFGYRMGGQNIAVHLWNTGTVDLAPRMVYAALFMASAAYDGGVIPDDVAVLSLTDGRLYRLSDVADQSRFAGVVAANLDQLFESVREEIGGPIVPPEIRPGNALARPD
jgi:hypothetical protein